MSETNGHKKLVAKLADVMAAVERVPKRGRNDFHKYDYATEADIAATIREELAKRQIMLLPAVTKMHREPVGEKGSVLTTLEMEFTFLDGETGEALTRPWAGAGTDKEDKGLYKAMTGGEKYYLLKTFLVPTGDDPERDEGKGKAHRQNVDSIVPARATEASQQQPDEAARLFPTASQEEKEVAAFEAGSNDCPSCGAKGTIIRSKPHMGGGWVCWARDKSKACGTKWPQKAQRTEEEKKAQVHRGTLTIDYVKERDDMLKEAGEISDFLDATDEQRKTWWNTYCEGAHKGNVDLAALTDLLKFLRLKKDQAQAR